VTLFFQRQRQRHHRVKVTDEGLNGKEEFHSRLPYAGKYRTTRLARQRRGPDVCTQLLILLAKS
jgi:hypothetical protein